MRFFNDTRAGVTMPMVLSLIAIITMMGAAIEASRVLTAKDALQRAVDAAALEAAIAQRLAESDQKKKKSTDTTRAQSVFETNVENTEFEDTALVNFDFVDDRVTAVGTAAVPSAFMDALGVEEYPIRAEAAATTLSGPPVCVFALDGGGAQTLQFMNTSQFEAVGCIAFSNSSNASALHTDSGVTATALDFCAVGGIVGYPDVLQPRFTENCPPLTDPAYAYPAAPQNCFGEQTVLDGVLASWVAFDVAFCNGLTVEGELELGDGVFFVGGGDFVIRGGGIVRGENLTIILGDGVNLIMEDDAVLNITAPKNEADEYASIALAQQPGSGHGTMTIGGRGVVNIIGTVYLPEYDVTVTGDASVGLETEFLAFLVNTIDFEQQSQSLITAKPTQLGYPDILPRAYSVPRLLK